MRLEHIQEIDGLKNKITAVLSFLGKIRHDNELLEQENEKLKNRLQTLEKNYGFDIGEMTLRPDWTNIFGKYDFDDIDHSKL